jgi:Kef-type K+ transport system membrane component KefB
MDPVVVVLVCLIAAALAGELLKAFGMPRAVGQIGAGMILGLPIIKPLLFDASNNILLGYLANIGVILLLFFAGLKVNFKSFVSNVKAASGLSLWNTTLPLAGGYLASKYLFGLDSSVSFIIGVCLSVTAAALALDLLEEFRLLKTKFGSLVISASAVDDVYETSLITITIAFIEALATKTAILTLLLNALIFVIAIIVFRLVIVPAFLRVLEKGTDVTLLMTGLIVTLLLSSLSSALGLGALVGALISGIVIRQALRADAKHHKPWEASHISHSVHTIAFGFLVPLFFIRAGMMTNLALIWQNIGFSITIAIIAITGTVLGCAIAHRIAGSRWKEGFLLGWALNSKGDTEIALATLALEAGIINSEIFSSLIFMAVISTLVSPLVFRSLLKHTRIH